MRFFCGLKCTTTYHCLCCSSVVFLCLTLLLFLMKPISDHIATQLCKPKAVLYQQTTGIISACEDGLTGTWPLTYVPSVPFYQSLYLFREGLWGLFMLWDPPPKYAVLRLEKHRKWLSKRAFTSDTVLTVCTPRKCTNENSHDGRNDWVKHAKRTG